MCTCLPIHKHLRRSEKAEAPVLEVYDTSLNKTLRKYPVTAKNGVSFYIPFLFHSQAAFPPLVFPSLVFRAHISHLIPEWPFVCNIFQKIWFFRVPTTSLCSYAVHLQSA